MLAPIFWPSSSPHDHLPLRPSPLSPRSANACPRPQFFTMSNAKSTRLGSQSDFAKRQIKPNPILKSKDEQRNQRRNRFLKQVSDSRDDKRWQNRTEQVGELCSVRVANPIDTVKPRFYALTTSPIVVVGRMNDANPPIFTLRIGRTRMNCQSSVNRPRRTMCLSTKERLTFQCLRTLRMRWR